MIVEPKITKPLVVSQLTAKEKVDEWMQENQVSYIEDAERTIWEITKTLTHLASQTNPKEFFWEIKCFFSCILIKDEIIKTKILDEVNDARLLSFLDKAPITLYTKPIIVTDAEQNKAEKKLHLALINFKDQLSKSNTRDIKRELICRFIDDKCCFKTPI